MRKALIVLLMVMLVTAAGCATAPQVPSPMSEMNQTPNETHKTLDMPDTPETPDQSPETHETPDETRETPSAAPDSTDPFFFHTPAGEPGDVAIRIYKGQRVLDLVMDGEVTGRFPIGLGSSPEGDKEKQGDGRTPVGSYYVCTRTDTTKYYLSLGVSYPNTEDAQKARDTGLIDQDAYDRIADAEARGARPDWDTPLGGAIAIHAGGATDWTQGCIATEDKTMDILWEYCPIGTPIVICE